MYSEKTPLKNKVDDSILDNEYKSYQHMDNEYESDYEEPVYVSFMRNLGSCFGYCCLSLGGICCYPYKSVDMGSNAVIQEYGRVKRNVADGLHYVNPITETITVANMKVQVIDLGKQNVMTSDKLSVNIDSVVYYKISNVHDALFKINNISDSIVQLSHATLRNVIGKFTLEECLGKREKIALSIKEIIDEHVHDWGITIISLQIKDIIVPENIVRSLSAAIIAERESAAKIITAQADVKSAELMRQAADILSTPAAMQIRSLEVIDRLARNTNSKIILIPSDLTLKNNIETGFINNEISNM